MWISGIIYDGLAIEDQTLKEPKKKWESSAERFRNDYYGPKGKKIKVKDSG
jgi:hypothetical protein